MMDILRRILGLGEDPTAVLAKQLAQSKEGVDWVARPVSAPADPAELTNDERIKALFASEDEAFDYANTWGPAGFRKGGPIAQSKTLAFRAYDPETATLTVSDHSGPQHSLTAYWIVNLQPHRDFAQRQEIEWSTSLTPSRGKGMRPALMARVYGDHAQHPSLPRDSRMGDERSALPYCYAAGSFIGLDDVLALADSATVTRYFIVDAADLPEAS